jgi:hypothetical protein
MNRRLRLEKAPHNSQLHHCNARPQKRGGPATTPLFVTILPIKGAHHQFQEYLLSLPQFPAEV